MDLFNHTGVHHPLPTGRPRKQSTPLLDRRPKAIIPSLVTTTTLMTGRAKSSLWQRREHQAPQGNPLPFSIWGFNHTKRQRDNRPGDDEDAAPSISIPLGHQTSVSNVLKLPQLRPLLGEYPEEFFFKVEAKRPRSAAAREMMCSTAFSLQDEFRIDKELGDAYLQSYLSRVHPYHPFIDAEDVVFHYENVMGREDRKFDFDNPSALVLAILSLGATVTDPIDRNEKERTGELLFQRALKILFTSWTFTFDGDVLISQALVLCALYFTYTVEPLMAWRLIHMASTSIQQLLSR